METGISVVAIQLNHSVKQLKLFKSKISRGSSGTETSLSLKLVSLSAGLLPRIKYRSSFAEQLHLAK
ncbi:hypothetical protein NIES4103_50370 [Nostoc sp. NIES-4103]|nr:hypothetical protein NIES4103_50370 [Nostoc sp. NIES-4103]